MHIQSACNPFVIHIFCPLITRSPPSLVAVLAMVATSLPAPGSLIPRQATMSPAMEGARNFRFSSSDPNLKRRRICSTSPPGEGGCSEVCLHPYGHGHPPTPDVPDGLGKGNVPPEAVPQR